MKSYEKRVSENKKSYEKRVNKSKKSYKKRDRTLFFILNCVMMSLETEVFL